MAEEKESFLSRWSRLKEQAQEKAGSEAKPPAAEPAEPAPQMPPLDKLSFESDYTGFFHPKVNEETRRAALKRLFSDPRFNVMDGLDVYIDDYSKPSPLPAEMLAALQQAQKILEWAKEGKDEDQPRPPGAVAAADEPSLNAASEIAGVPDEAKPTEAEPVPVSRTARNP